MRAEARAVSQQCMWCQQVGADMRTLHLLRLHEACAGPAGFEAALKAPPPAKDAFPAQWASDGAPVPGDLAAADVLHRYAARFAPLAARHLLRVGAGNLDDEEMTPARIGGIALAARAVHLHGRGRQRLDPRAMDLLLNLAIPLVDARMQRALAPGTPTLATPVPASLRLSAAVEGVLRERAFLRAVEDLFLELKVRDAGALGSQGMPLELAVGEGVRACEERARALGAPPLVSAPALAEAMGLDGIDEWAYLDPETGEVEYVHACALDVLGEDAEPAEHWVRIPARGSREDWGNRADFAEALQDGEARRALSDALRGEGAFRRFRAAVEARPAVREAWSAWARARAVERARAWAEDEGLNVVLLER